MNEKSIKVAGLTKELLADLDKLFPKKTPEVNMDMKVSRKYIGQQDLAFLLKQLQV